MAKASKPRIERTRHSSKATPLKKLRQAHGLNQAEMALLLRVSQQSYSRYESGAITPDVGTQARICSVLQVTRPELWPLKRKKEGTTNGN